MNSSDESNFWLFPELPIELRRQVWRNSFRDPHSFIVELDLCPQMQYSFRGPHPFIDQHESSESTLDTQIYCLEKHPNWKEPPTLFANHESRAVALEQCVKKTRSRFKTYLDINFEIDDFTLAGLEFWNPHNAMVLDATKSEMAQFKYITAPLPCGFSMRDAIVRWVFGWMRAFPSLVGVTLETYSTRPKLDLAAAKDTIASFHYALVALEKQEREAGRSWKAPRLKVIFQELHNQRDKTFFRYEAQLPIEDELNPTSA